MRSTPWLAILGGLASLAAATALAQQPTLALRTTNYYLALQEDYPPGKDAAFLDAAGNVLTRASSAFKDAAQIEGSARLRDGRVLNFDVEVDGEYRWTFIADPFGSGAICPLIPLRSAAVDPELVPLGSILSIAETRGLPLPDGGRHDGVWYAVDVGTTILGDRIDLFTGAGEGSMAAIYDHGIEHLQPLTVTIIGALTECPPVPG